MGRLRALDGLRGMLALYVLAGHTMPFLFLPAGLAGLGALVSHGAAAVDLFFVLSGLAIARSIEGLAGCRRAVPRFLAARAGRLLPVYALALLLACLGLSLGNPAGLMTWLPASGAAPEILGGGWPTPWFWHLIAHLCLLQGALPQALLPYAANSLLGPAWSLSTEWQFYLLTALMLALLRARGPTDGFFRCWIIVLLLLGGAGLGTALLPAAWHFGRAFLPFDAGYFALGLASERLLRNAEEPSERRFFALILAIACALGWLTAHTGAVLVPLAWTLCLGFERPDAAPAIVRPVLRQGYRLLTTPALLGAGRISYPLYLIHAPIQRLLMLWLGPLAHGDWGRFTLLWVGPAFALPILAAVLVHAWVEEPLRRWSRARLAEQATAVTPRLLYGSGSNTSAAGQP
jgi:peptidoglycan/LPS O-acetylase OafA/YrhL